MAISAAGRPSALRRNAELQEINETKEQNARKVVIFHGTDCGFTSAEGL